MNLPPAKTVDECAEQCLGCFESFLMAGIKEPERTAELKRLESIIQRFADQLTDQVRERDKHDPLY